MGFYSECGQKSPWSYKQGSDIKQSQSQSPYLFSLSQRQTDRHTHTSLLEHFLQSRSFESGPRLTPHCLRWIPHATRRGRALSENGWEAASRQHVRTLGPWEWGPQPSKGPKEARGGDFGSASQAPTVLPRDCQEWHHKGGSRLHEKSGGTSCELNYSLNLYKEKHLWALL